MSIYNIDFNNNYKARFESLIADDIFQLNRDTNQYERVGNGGSGPGPVELPYYLKSNSIQVDNTTISNTVMDSNSFDVVDIVNDKSSSLLADKLVLGDAINGNSELDKPKIDLLTELNTGMTASAPTYSNVNTVFPIAYDSINKKFIKSTGFRIGQGTSSVLINENGGINAGSSTDRTFIGTSGANILYNNNIWTTFAQGYMKITDKTTPFPATLIDTSQLKIGCAIGSTNSNFDATKDSIAVNKTGVVLYDAATSTASTLNINSFLTLNKIRDVTADVGTSDHKMLIYNPTTKNYNYADFYYQWVAANDLRNRTAGNPLASTNRVLMHEAGTGAFSYVNLNDTFAAANKVRDITTTTIDSNKKMVIYDAVTSNLNYTDIPSGTSVPSYIYSDKIEMDSSGSGYIKTQNPSGSSAASITKAGVLELTNAAGQRNDLDSLGVKFVNENKNDKFYVFYYKFHQGDPNKTIRLGFWDDETVVEHGITPNTFEISDFDLGNPYQEMKYTEGKITLDLKFVNGGHGFVNGTSKFIFLENSGLNLHNNPYDATADQILDINYTPRMTDDTHGYMPTFSVTLCRMKINKSPTMIDKIAIHVECNTAGATSSTEFKGYLSFRIVKRSKMNINSQNQIPY